VATGSNDVDEIYQRMAVIRREHHTNVRESVAGAEAMADWGRYTWTYPWIALGAAAAAGYLIYRSGHQRGTAGTARPAEGDEAGELVAAVRTGRERSWPNRILLPGAWDILSPVAIRAGQNFMLQWLEQQFRPNSVDRTALSPLAREQGASVGPVDREGIGSPQRLQSKPRFFGGQNNDRSRSRHETGVYSANGVDQGDGAPGHGGRP
jgi:hypothetical protein